MAISTTEAEVVDAGEGACELVRLVGILGELTNLTEVSKLIVANEATVRLSHNPEFLKRTSHIRVRHFLCTS